jgi:hypothetical protein
MSMIKPDSVLAPIEKVKRTSEYLTSLANIDLLFPAFLNLALAKRTTDKPAKVPGAKFPSRTIMFNLLRTLSYHPAGPAPFTMGLLQCHEKQELTFA